MTVDIDTTSGVRASQPRLLFEGPYQNNPTVPAYDVTPDGLRFIMGDATTFDTPATEMHVILNWTEDLKRRVPSN